MSTPQPGASRLPRSLCVHVCSTTVDRAATGCCTNDSSYTLRWQRPSIPQQSPRSTGAHPSRRVQDISVQLFWWCAVHTKPHAVLLAKGRRARSKLNVRDQDSNDARECSASFAHARHVAKRFCFVFEDMLRDNVRLVLCTPVRVSVISSKMF